MGDHEALAKGKRAVGCLANSRVILIQGLPLSYHVAEENISVRTRMDVFPSHSAGNYRGKVRERMHIAHYKKAGAESEGLLQKLAGGRWLPHKVSQR